MQTSCLSNYVKEQGFPLQSLEIVNYKVKPYVKPLFDPPMFRQALNNRRSRENRGTQYVAFNPFAEYIIIDVDWPDDYEPDDEELTIYESWSCYHRYSSMTKKRWGKHFLVPKDTAENVKWNKNRFPLEDMPGVEILCGQHPIVLTKDFNSADFLEMGSMPDTPFDCHAYKDTIVSLSTDDKFGALLASLDPIHCHDQSKWFMITVACKNEDQKEAWDTWSQTCPEKYDKAANEHTWEGIRIRDNSPSIAYIKSRAPTQIVNLEDSEERETYEQVKARFEDDGNFLIISPLLYCYKWGDWRSRNEWLDLLKPYQLHNGKKYEDFAPTWLKDPDRKTYIKTVCEPHNKLEGDPTPDDVYNTAVPFAYDYIPDDERNPDALVDLKTLLYGLCTVPEEEEYYLHFIADILQYPRRNPELVVVMKGHAQGTGKDTIIRVLGCMLGKKYVTTAQGLNGITGQFNVQMDGRIVFGLNELDGKEGSAGWDKMKAQITNSTNLINQKNVKIYEQPNYMRAFISSNNHNPTPGDRRTVVFQTRPDHKKPEFWPRFNKMLRDKNYIDSMASELMDIQLPWGEEMPHPLVTKTQADRAIAKGKSIHEFAQKICEGGFDWLEECGQWKVCKGSELRDEYKHFSCRDYHQKNFKKELDNWFGQEYQCCIDMNGRVTIAGKQVRRVKIDTVKLEECLRNQGLWTEPVEEDEDIMSDVEQMP